MQTARRPRGASILCVKLVDHLYWCRHSDVASGTPHSCTIHCMRMERNQSSLVIMQKSRNNKHNRKTRIRDMCCDKVRVGLTKTAAHVGATPALRLRRVILAIFYHVSMVVSMMEAMYTGSDSHQSSPCMPAKPARPSVSDATTLISTHPVQQTEPEPNGYQPEP